MEIGARFRQPMPEVDGVVETDSSSRHLAGARQTFRALREKCCDLAQADPHDIELWRRLDDMAERGGSMLDLSDISAEALERLDPQMMEALGELTSNPIRRLAKVTLAAGLSHLPNWMPAFASVTDLSVSRFPGSQLDVTRLPALQVLHLTELDTTHRVDVRTLALCKLLATCVDEKPARVRATRVDDGTRLLCIVARRANYNMLVLFEEDESKSIACRHMALQALVCWAQEDPKRGAFRGFKSAQDVGALVPYVSMNDFHERLLMRPVQAHLVSHANWGEFVSRHIALMEIDSLAVSCLLLTSPRHSMGARVRLLNDAGQEECSVEFFDPNISDAIRTCKPPFKFEHLFDGKDRYIVRYFSEPDEGHQEPTVRVVRVTVIPDPLNLESAVAGKGRSSLTIDMADLAVNWSPLLIWDLIVHDQAGALEELVDHMGSAQLMPEVCELLLRARSPNRGLPGLYQAVHSSFLETIAVVGRAICAAAERGLLSPPAICNLLHAWDPMNFQSALARAYGYKDPSVMNALLRIVRKLARMGVLSADQVVDLLLARNNSGVNTVARIKNPVAKLAFRKAVGRLKRMSALSKDQAADLLGKLKK